MWLIHPLVRLLVSRSTPVPEILMYTRHVCETLTANPWVPAPTLALAAVSADADALQAAQVLALTRGKGLAEARNHRLVTLFTDLEALRGDVQVAVDADVARAAEIAAACGMTLRRAGARHKAELAARMTGAPGVAKLAARAAKRGASYDWEMSSDGGLTWAAAARSTVASTTVGGLVAGAVYMFRVRTTLGQVTSDWRDAISFRAR
jgi:hypothetical protein